MLYFNFNYHFFYHCAYPVSWRHLATYNKHYCSVGTNSTAWHNPEWIKSDYVALDKKMKDLGVQLVSGLNWIDALPIVMLHLRNTPNRKYGLTPFEILFGRPFPVFYAPLKLQNLSEESNYLIKCYIFCQIA